MNRSAGWWRAYGTPGFGEQVRPHVWGRILKGINLTPNRTRAYEIADIQDGV
jgi:hypothetical protein